MVHEAQDPDLQAQAHLAAFSPRSHVFFLGRGSEPKPGNRRRRRCSDKILTNPEKGTLKRYHVAKVKASQLLGRVREKYHVRKVKNRDLLLGSRHHRVPPRRNEKIPGLVAVSTGRLEQSWENPVSAFVVRATSRYDPSVC